MIQDGHNYTARVRSEPGLHDELLFNFRPCNVLRMAEFREELRGKDEVGIEKATAELLAERVTHWNRDEPLNADSMLELGPVLYGSLFKIVTGKMPSDPLSGGKPADTYIQEEAEKNSEAGSGST